MASDLIAELAEVVAYAWRKDGMRGWALGHNPPTPNMIDFAEYEVRELTFRTPELTRILTDDAAIRAAHTELVIRLGEVTEKLEAAKRDARGERDETWEVWQDDMPVAVSDSLPDALHYLAMYQQDGPVTLKRAMVYRETITPEQLAAMRDSAREDSNG